MLINRVHNALRILPYLGSGCGDKISSRNSFVRPWWVANAFENRYGTEALVLVEVGHGHGISHGKWITK